MVHASLESFVHKVLKDEQIECIHRIVCHGRDVLAVLPTGLHKSAIYQLKKSVVSGRVLPEKLGGGVRSASQNPYPIYDQNLRYSLPYL